MKGIKPQVQEVQRTLRKLNVKKKVNTFYIIVGKIRDEKNRTENYRQRKIEKQNIEKNEILINRKLKR